jgi:DNA invertase Pin-like site-specific DNA recombinase
MVVDRLRRFVIAAAGGVRVPQTMVCGTSATPPADVPDRPLLVGQNPSDYQRPKTSDARRLVRRSGSHARWLSARLDARSTLRLAAGPAQKAGCKRIFSDVAGGATAERPGLSKAFEFVRSGDTLVVWKLDRLGRSLRHLIESVNDLQKRKIGFRSLQESIDTTTSGGKLVFHVFGALSEFEREVIRERTNAGLVAARARGRKGGRPRVLDDKKLALARTLHKDNTAPAVICATLGISRSSLYRYLANQPVASDGCG